MRVVSHGSNLSPCCYSGSGRFSLMGIRSTHGIGAVAMGLSTIIVSVNAQMLGRLKLQPVAPSEAMSARISPVVFPESARRA